MAASQSRTRSSGTAAAAVPVELDVDEHLHLHRHHQLGRGARQEEEEEKADLRRGPWTVDEDLTLVNYIADNGEGRWNSLARAAGLKRTGKSCRLRWLNYLRPDVKRGNFSADEQLLILDLHTRWGNRWSKIAQHLPGRTDNEIKNYWRTRVQKHAKQLNCDATSKRFKDAMRYLWMPHLVDVVADDRHHHRRLLHAQQAQQQQAAAGAAGGYATAAADVHDLSSGMAAMTSSSDSFASESYEDGGGLFANVHAAAGEMLMNGGGDLAPQEGNQQSLVLWPSDQTMQATAGSQFQDAELSGWVQGFSESITDNFWALEEIWKIQ